MSIISHASARRVALSSFSILALGLTACGAAPDAAPDGEVATTEEPIINGTALSEAEVRHSGLVAIYHKLEDGTFYPRPCSGIFVNTGPALSVIATARHCVTKGDGIDGTLFTPAEVKTSIYVTATANPGLHGSNAARLSTPHPDWKAADSVVYAPPLASVLSFARDVALIYVWGDFSKHFPSLGQVGWYMPDPATLVGRSVTAYGYGVNVKNPTGGTYPLQHEDTCYSTFPSSTNPNPTHDGAGTARRSASFPVTHGQPGGPHFGFYTHANNSGGTAMLCGDSGGPDLMNLLISGVGSMTHVTGIHSQAAYQFANMSRLGPWLSVANGGLYVSPYSLKTAALGLTGNTLTMAPKLNVPVKRFFYYPEMERIGTMINEDEGICFELSGSSVVLNPCLTPPPASQIWVVDGNNRIRNPSTNRCLRHIPSSGSVSAPTCLPSFASDTDRPAETWFWHTEFDQDYTVCATEGGFCSFSGKRHVRYGAQGVFTYRTATGGTACNNATFGDPAPGFAKHCAVGPAGFSFCADQNGTCSFQGTKIVAYGANNSFVYTVRTNGTACTKNALDPFSPAPPPSLVQKSCYVQD